MIRKAKNSDKESIVTLMVDFNAMFEYPIDKESTAQNLEKFLSNEALGSILVIEIDNELKGYGVVALGFSFENNGTDAFIDEVFLKDEIRDKGLGKELLNSLIKEARNKGANKLHLEVERLNTRAKDLYQKLGFAENERILMSKDISKPVENSEDSNGGLPDIDFKHFLGCGG